MRNREDDTDSSEGSSSDLDLCSPGFKPLRVLYSRKTTVPAPSAKQHDNVGTFESKFKRLGGFAEKYCEQRLKDIQTASSSKTIVPVASGEAPVRRFLPHQRKCH